MITVSIARRYARALLETGQEQATLEQIGTTLDQLVQALRGQPELRDVMENPAFSHAARHAMLDKLLALLQAPPAAANLLRLLVDRNRIPYLEAIARAYRDLADARVGRVRARLVSAVPLDDGTAGRIRDDLSRITQRQVTLERRVEPSILGGAVAQVGSTVYDGSLQKQLELLRRQLRS